VKVVIVSNAYPPHVAGGAELVACYLAEGLAAGGCDVTVVTTCSRDEGTADGVLNGVRVVRFFPNNLWWNFERFATGDRRSLPAKLVWNLRDTWNRDTGRRLGAVLDSVKPDVVHTHNLKGMSPIVWHTIARRGVPIIHTAHDYYLLCARGAMLRGDGTACDRRCALCRVYGQYYAACARPIDLLCSPSRFVLERHLEHGVGERARSAVVPNGIPLTPRHRPARAKGEKLRALFLGQLRREKGVHVLLDALAHLRDDVVVDIAGRGELQPQVELAAGSRTGVTFHGYVAGAAKAALLDAADVLLFPSIWSENAPIAIAESLVSGMPVIGSDIGAIPEFVSDGVNGLLFRVGDPAALAQAVNSVAADAVLYEALCAGATASAGRYTVDTMVDRYRRLYETLAPQHAAAVEAYG